MFAAFFWNRKCFDQASLVIKRLLFCFFNFFRELLFKKWNLHDTVSAGNYAIEDVTSLCFLKSCKHDNKKLIIKKTSKSLKNDAEISIHEISCTKITCTNILIPKRIKSIPIISCHSHKIFVSSGTLNNVTPWRNFPSLVLQSGIQHFLRTIIIFNYSTHWKNK